MNPEAARRYAKNRAALLQHAPDLLEKLWVGCGDTLRVRALPAGQPELWAATAAGERRVGFESEREALRWLARQPLERAGCGTLFLFGLPLAAHLPALLPRLSPHARLVLLEPSPALLAAMMEVVDLTPLLTRPQSQLLVGPLPELVEALAGRLEPMRLVEHPTLLLAHPDLAWLAPGFAEEAESELARLSRLLALELRADLFEAQSIVENTLENAPAVAGAPGVEQLAGILEGQSVVVLSQGAALAEALPLLSRYRHRVVVMSTSAALRECLAGGVIPDFALALDPSAHSDRDFHHLEIPAEVVFILEPRTLPLTWRRGQGRRLVGVLSDAWARTRASAAAGQWLAQALGGRGELEGGGSRTLTLAALAAHAGAGMILFLEPDGDYPGAGLERPDDPTAGAEARANRQAFVETARRDLARWAAARAARLLCVARGAAWPGLECLSLAEALAASWADAGQLRARLDGILDNFQATDPARLLEELDEELYHAGDYPTPALTGVVRLYAQRARWEAERMRLAAEMAPGSGRRRELTRAAAAREEEGLAAAHLELRRRLARLRRRLLAAARSHRRSS